MSNHLTATTSSSSRSPSRAVHGTPPGPRRRFPGRSFAHLAGSLVAWLVVGQAWPRPAYATPVAGIKPGGSSSAVSPASTGKLASGLEALERADYAAAERDLRAVTGGAAKDAARASIALARLACETGKYAEAEVLARKAAALAGTDAPTKLDAIGWQATAAFAVGRLDDARRLVEPLRDEPKAPRARSLLVQVLVRQGDRDEARSVAEALEADSEGEDVAFKDPSALAAVGRAAHAVRHIKYANASFKEAMRLRKKHVETNVAWARLFLDYYDPGHAAESVREIIEAAPDLPVGHLLSAEVKLAQTMDWEDAERHLDLALKGNPRLARAYFVKGAIALHDGETKLAEEAIAKGLAIDPNALDLLSLRAAARYLDDDPKGYERAKAEVFKRNPKYSTFFIDVGEFAEWEHRYDDLVTMMKEGTKVDPTDGKVWAELGFNLLRRGDEKDGLAALDAAYKHDKFNVRLVNTLNLFERTIATKFELDDGTGTAKPFRFRFDKEEAPLLGRYAPDMLGKAWGVMVKKYGFTPQHPVQVEVFPERTHFSVRTDGVPNIGPTGVCFGRVITAVSPKNEASNWGLVLWHELAHVFAIQISKNRVPRWFTEGLSEYETIVTRPEWRRALDPQLYLAVRAGRLPKIAEMNRAFTHARSTQDVVVAYYASSQMVLYIAEAHGFPKVVEMLKAWGEAKKTPEVVKKALGVDADTLDTEFRAWLRRRLARYDGQFMFDPRSVPEVEDAEKTSNASPGDAGKLATYAAALFVERKLKEADAAAAKALAIEPTNRLASYLAAKLAYGVRHDVDAAKRHATTLAVSGGDGYVVETMLADLAEASKDAKGARAALEKAATFDPTQSDPLLGLLKMAETEGRSDDVLALLRRMVKLDPHERLPWKRLLDELTKRGLWDEAVAVGEGAVYVDIYAPEVHARYARALGMKARTKDAQEEIEGGLAAKPRKEGEAMLRVERARLFVRDKEAAKARAEIELALKLDPRNAEAVKLKGEIK